MIMKHLLSISAISMFAVSLAAAESSPKVEVTTAARKLAENSYGWKTTIEVPESSQFRPGPTEGKIDRDGTVFLVLTLRDNTVETVKKGDKGAVKMEDGWRSFAELTSGHGQPNRGMFIARMVQNLKAPAAQAEELVGFAKDLNKTDGAYASDLTETGAKQLLTFGPRRGGGPQPPEPKGAKGSLKIWLKDGMLTKYQYNVQGKISFNDQEFDIDRTTTTEMKDVGSTKVVVPDEAKSKLQ